MPSPRNVPENVLHAMRQCLHSSIAGAAMYPDYICNRTGKPCKLYTAHSIARSKSRFRSGLILSEKESTMLRCLVAGGGGFIAGHLIRRLLDKGYEVVAADIKAKEDWEQWHDRAMNYGITDLKLWPECAAVCEDVDYVYNLACDMGGIGFIENNKAVCMLSVLINTHLLQASVAAGVKRYFYASSACVYAAGKQDQLDMPALKESDAYPAMPEDGYGWEKLFSERMCRHFTEDFGLETRVARFHNVYGPHGSWQGGREKVPAAICRKIARLKQVFAPRDSTLQQNIEIWGDGNQQRSFMWIGDCIDGIRRLMESDVTEPINIGSSELVSINRLIEIVEDIAEISPERKYNLSKPQGVKGRNSDNTLILERLHWQPTTSLRDGLEKTYRWIEDQVRKQHG